VTSKKGLTGESPMQGSTPDALLALHDAGYREVAARLPDGLVLDVGCGVGDETATLGGPNRTVIGVDYSAPTVVDAGRERGSAELRFAAMDGSVLGVRDHSCDAIVSSHIIEHFTNPVTHVAEIARALHADGTAFFITPNAPADFENPFHLYLFEPDHLVSMLKLFFEDVECLGLEGDDALHADFAARRASGDKLLRLDVFNLRHKIPRSAYVWSYERVLPAVYKMLGSEKTGIGSGLDASHLFITKEIKPTTPVLFATARRPRNVVGAAVRAG